MSLTMTRVRDIEVTALGASRRSIVTLILLQGMTLTGIGIAIGLGGAIAASRAIASMLYGISQFDPMTYAGVTVLLAGVLSNGSVSLRAFDANHTP